ncbi:hypothetical protein F4860DRAFT_517642 [Xylaria cubensis]|nr:hypothetical protein F4860DRAFT_517642 [Xylaria cubensis]
MALSDLFDLLGPEIEDPEEGESKWAAHVLELGCGISGLVGLVLSPLVSRYVLTDQVYVARLVEKNLEENLVVSQQRNSSQKRKGKPPSTANPVNLRFTTLDWELDEVTSSSLTGSSQDVVTSLDAVIACDCIYNETLIEPLVQTCADACGLRQRSIQNHEAAATSPAPALCIVAQQLRDPEIFEGWIKAFSRRFRVWRVPEEALSEELRANTGFVVHIGVLKNDAAGP